MRLPKYPTSMKIGLPAFCQDVIGWMRANTIRSVSGGKIKRTPNGITISVGSKETNVSAVGSSHPFKIRTAIESEEIRLYVSHGMVSAMIWTDGEDFPCTREIPCLINSNLLENSPSGSGVGYLTLSASTNYGVWIAVDYGGGSISSTSYDSDFTLINLYEPTASSCVIHVDTTYVASTDGPGLTAADASDRAFVFLGTVSVDSDGVGTVAQYRRSDVMMPLAALPANFV